MLNLKLTISAFLMYARQLIFGVRDDLFIRERVLAYNFDDARITYSVTAYYDAEKAQSDRLKELGEQLAASAQFEAVWTEAKALWQKHTDFLKLTLREDFDKQRKLFLVGLPRSRKFPEWFEHMKAMYDRVLADDDVVAAVGAFNISREDLEAGRQKVVEAEDAKRKHLAEQGEAEHATDQRDKAFEILFKIVEELETICPYALEDTPQRLEKLGIPVYSPGYKPKSNTANEEPAAQEPQEPQEEPTQVTQNPGTVETTGEVQN
jgi:hypothetical protein